MMSRLANCGLMRFLTRCDTAMSGWPSTRPATSRGDGAARNFRCCLTEGVPAGEAASFQSTGRKSYRAFPVAPLPFNTQLAHFRPNTILWACSLVKLRTLYLLQYERSLDALAASIIMQVKTQSLQPLKDLDFDAVESAWEVAAAKDPQSHTEGNISKTCFVFVSAKGWDWVPYDGTPAEIGALAQKISGELSLKYEEIPCDAALPEKLREANENNVPTVLFGDPASLVAGFQAKPMQQYDLQYLLNCAAVVAWEPNVKDTIETDPRWLHLKTLFKQKANNPPPYHEWRSIFSRDDLDQKTRTLIEQIRSRLMKQLVSAVGSTPRKAEDAAISQSAAALGINVASLSHLESPTQ
jgi:hypothetical protein